MEPETEPLEPATEEELQAEPEPRKGLEIGEAPRPSFTRDYPVFGYE